MAEKTKALKALAEWRESGAPRKNPLERAQAKPASLRAAINAKCWQCMGEDQDPGVWSRVRGCPVTDCGLYQLRRK